MEACYVAGTTTAVLTTVALLFFTLFNLEFMKYNVKALQGIRRKVAKMNAKTE